MAKLSYIYLYIENKALLYLQYIDGIFMIWKVAKEELVFFINNLNKQHKTIKFDSEILSKTIPFFDTMIHIEEDIKLNFKQLFV